jgi:dienelactone hydrolase
VHDAPAPGRPLLTRRRLLAGGAATVVAGGAALAGIEAEALPGKAWLYHHLGHDGADGVLPDVAPIPVTYDAFDSRARGRRVGWALARPDRTPTSDSALPLVIALHGRGQDHRSAFRADRMGLDRYLADAVAHGVHPFAIASVDGAETYWHDRADGDRAETMVVEELVPLVAEHGVDTSRIAFAGWSMGGFGGLHLATALGPDRVVAVAALSPALWPRYDEAAPHAYDDAADFERVSVWDRQHLLDGIAVRVDCGKGDPFYAHTRDYVAGFDRAPAGGFELGDHDSGYWRRMAPAVLRFLGAALSS